MEGPQATADEEKQNVDKLIAVLKAEAANVSKILEDIRDVHDT